MISCQLTEGHLDDAEQQLDFLNEIQSSGTQSAVRLIEIDRGPHRNQYFI